jgi:TatD DNase family protein
VRESALVVPDDRILIETDSPYLAPIPKRGTRNEPANLVHTAKFLAELRNTALEDFVALVGANAEKMLAANVCRT